VAQVRESLSGGLGEREPGASAGAGSARLRHAGRAGQVLPGALPPSVPFDQQREALPRQHRAARRRFPQGRHQIPITVWTQVCDSTLSQRLVAILRDAHTSDIRRNCCKPSRAVFVSPSDKHGW